MSPPPPRGRSGARPSRAARSISEELSRKQRRECSLIVRPALSSGAYIPTRGTVRGSALCWGLQGGQGVQARPTGIGRGGPAPRCTVSHLGLRRWRLQTGRCPPSPCRARLRVKFLFLGRGRTSGPTPGQWIQVQMVRGIFWGVHCVHSLS